MKKNTILIAILLFLGGLSAILIWQRIHLLLFEAIERSLRNEAYACKDCNVILITLTNLRSDHLSGNGYSRPTSPNLDAMAQESFVFDNTFSHSSWTLPEGISLYTSLYPYQHEIMNRYDGNVLSGTTRTLVDILNDSGYKTAAFTGGFDYSPQFGLTNRFGEYQECGGNVRGPTILSYGKLQCAMPKALAWIKDNLGAKFFVHIQGYDTHCPFTQAGGDMYDKDYAGSVDYSECLWTFDKAEPQIVDDKVYYRVASSATKGESSILLGQEDIAHLIALYDESITLSDVTIGLFLEEIREMGLLENTIIVFTSEHGDMFGKHGRFMRGGPLRGTFYDDVLHIPLWIKHPGIQPGRTGELVEHVDIMPTLLGFLSLKRENLLQGKSLIPLIAEGKKIHEYVFAGTEYNPGEDNFYFNENTRVEAIRSEKWKLIRETVIAEDSLPPQLELYDIVDDKEELNNLAATEKSILDSLQTQLADWSERMRRK